jgi:hypothetical protein
MHSLVRGGRQSPLSHTPTISLVVSDRRCVLQYCGSLASGGELDGQPLRRDSPVIRTAGFTSDPQLPLAKIASRVPFPFLETTARNTHRRKESY